jgi:hypothetical protein
MRAVFLIAILASSSILVADERTNPLAHQPDPPRASGLSRPADAPTTDAPSPRSAYITIRGESVGIDYAAEAAPQNGWSIASPAALLIVCDRFDVAGSAEEGIKVHCKGCQVMLPSGMKGNAVEATYDTRSNKLTLNGSESEPLTLTMEGNGSAQTITAPKLDLTIKFVQPVGAPMSDDAEADPFGEGAPAPTFAPQPGRDH